MAMQSCGEAVNSVSPVGVLVSYEIVVSADDFFVSVNGPVLPSECSGFSVNADGCLVFHQADGDIISYPIPDVFQELIASSSQVLFVKFEDGVVGDSCELIKESNHGGR